VRMCWFLAAGGSLQNVSNMPRTPSLDALRTFVVAARYLSFTEAAIELNLTQSAVSHRIRGLEEELGLSLFNRLTRRLELTPQGRALAHRVDHAISEIDRSVLALGTTDTDPPLKVTMLPSVASHWLIPRLARIRDRHPKVEVQVIADPRLLDIRAEGIDLAIRFGSRPNASYRVTRLMSDRVIPVCTPDLLHHHGPVDSVEALIAMPLLHDTATVGDGSHSDWQSWLAHCGKSKLLCHAGQHFSEADMLINAAMLGLGVALARLSLVADYVAGGALVCPLPIAAPTAYCYYLLNLPEQVDRPSIATFRELVIAESARTEAFMLSLGMPRPIAA
jgi:LysR family transcriptional regulator, glycine cleavage system transcriptional activator